MNGQSELFSRAIVGTPASRRQFLRKAGLAGCGLAAISLCPSLHAAKKKDEIDYPKGKAEHCIFIWLGGGAAHVDTWDPKRRGDGKKIAGSAYDAIDTAIPGVKVTEHLSHCAKILDRFVLVRTVNHNVIDEHAAATNRVHTGRPTSGTVIYPSIGSILAHDRKSAV